MAAIEYREYQDQDADSFLRLHDSAFPAITAQFWREFSQGDVTAAVALLNGEVVGTVPFQFRDLCLCPGVSVRVAWEFSVCVRQDMRGAGIGSRLMDTAKQFLQDRCAAMAVYRNDEFSPAYQYYSRNDHYDLVYMRPWTAQQGMHASPLPSAPVVSVAWESFLAHEDEYLAVFANAYNAYAGFPRREAGYYARAVKTPEYAEVPLELSVLAHRRDDGTLQGYAIIGLEGARLTLHLMELATRGQDAQVALSLLSAFARAASARDAQAVASVTDNWPYRPVLEALSFRPATRATSSMVLMLHPLNAAVLARAAWRDGPATAPLDVHVWTPQREVVLHRAQDGVGRRILLEMKDETLARLVTCRLDLTAALREGSVTPVGADDASLEAVARALPLTPWTYHYLDFV